MIIACCGSEENAQVFAAALAMDPIGDPTTHGHGAPRPSKEELQAQYIFARSESFVFAGRSGLCKDISILQCLATPLDGTLVVADVGSVVSVENNLSKRVAAIEVTCASVRESDLGIVAWDTVANTFSQKSVRV